MVTIMGSTISSYLSWFFSHQDYMPHGMCFLWQPELIWLHVISDSAIALAYYSMPAALIYFAMRRSDLVFRGVFVLTGLFILACGTTHVMNVWTLWHPDYRLDGIIKALTAVVSLGTSYAMWRAMPVALTLPSTGQLERANYTLNIEVNERRRVETALRDANTLLEDRLQQIESMSRSLQQRKAELEIANRELETFAYSASHDLRAPLRIMAGFSKALLEDYGNTLDETAQGYLQRIYDSGVHMDRLISGLLNLARVTRSELESQSIDLSALARRIVVDLQTTEPERKVTVDIAPNLTAYGDPRLIEALLQNLLGNAWKFTGKNPNARIEMGASGPVYYVRDNGVGFDMKQAGKLFQAFQRLHTTDEFEGTGIGLATVFRICERHGGKIGIESAVGKGTTVYFTLSSTDAKDDRMLRSA